MHQPASTPTKPRRKWLLGCAAIPILGALFLVVAFFVLDQPLPEAEPGPQADALGKKMMAAVNVEAWNSTGAVAWDFGGRQQHLWDRQRQLSRVRWDEDKEVLLDLTTRQGLAYEAGQELTGPEAEAMLEKAWELWCNDSFWLNPIAKLFDEGTHRGRVAPLDPEGEDFEGEALEGLLITYDSGGVTPGDSYLWRVGEDGLPRQWQMWTQILPIGGIEASWEEWTTLSGGAKVATRHKTPVFELVLSDLRAAPTAAELEGGADPFAPLVASLGATSSPSPNSP